MISIKYFWILITFIALLLTTACSSEAPIDKQKDSFHSWKSDFNLYSAAKDDYATKYNLIVRQLYEGTISKEQAYLNLKDISNKYIGFHLLLQDKFKIPEGFNDKNTELFKKSKQSFEYSLNGNHDAVKNLLNYLDSPEPKYLSEIKNSLDFSDSSYKKSLEYQDEISTNLGINE
ncbi:MAG: hypothetical protein K0R55_225 [Sporomusa sp.]|nr:hypothetical protein [Sporomusa sp.]